jgi:hypothetical protein
MYPSPDKLPDGHSKGKNVESTLSAYPPSFRNVYLFFPSIFIVPLTIDFMNIGFQLSLANLFSIEKGIKEF